VDDVVSGKENVFMFIYPCY